MPLVLRLVFFSLPPSFLVYNELLGDCYLWRRVNAFPYAYLRAPVRVPAFTGPLRFIPRTGGKGR